MNVDIIRMMSLALAKCQNSMHHMKTLFSGCEIITCGKVEGMSMLCGRFLQYMQHVHPDNYNPLYTAQKLKARITAEFEPQLVFWQPQQRFKSELVFPANQSLD